MNVAFDGACFADGPITGVGRAFLNGLAAYAAAFPGTGTLLVPEGACVPPIPGLSTRGAPRGALRRQLTLPGLLRRLGADVLHSSVAAVPLHTRCATIATLHDVPWRHPEAEERSSLWRRFATRRALRAAAAVIAPSAFTRADAVALRGDERGVVQIAHGITLPPLGATAPRHGPFLVLGDARPRKNRERVAAAHARARRTHPGLAPLRFVGPPDAYVDEPTKATLLTTCTAVVQCSLFEGFGMPVLEALAHGAPTICSALPPFGEIAGDLATYVDPRDENAIAAALVAVATSPDTHARAEARRARATGFTAAATAGAWYELHRSLCR